MSSIEFLRSTAQPTDLLVPNRRVEKSKALWVPHLQTASLRKPCLSWYTWYTDYAWVAASLPSPCLLKSLSGLSS